MMPRLRFLFLFFLVPAAACAQEADDFNPRVVIERPFPPIERPFPPIKNPEIATLKEADGKAVRDEELVLGVVVGQTARAYPINTLTGPRREIINDHLDGEPIAATW